ncbi:MAG: DUF2937 family protein [Alphaproteobacteria bacterium]
MLRGLHILFALVCAVLLSQAPAFYQQYLQRLGGALDEATAQVEDLDRRAMDAGMERYQYIRHFQSNDDQVIRAEGDAMVDLVARQVRLEDWLARLEQAPWYMILIELAFHLDPKIAENTARSFEPSLPLSISGGSHAFLGFFFGFLFPSGIRSLFPRKVVRQG